MRSLRRKRVSLFPKNQRPRNEKTSVRAKKKRNENWKSNPIPSNSVQSRRRSALAEWEGDEGGGGEQKEKQFLKSPENKKVFFDWNQFKLFSRKAAGICPNKTKGFNGVERIWSRLQSECIHQIHLRVPTTGTTPAEDQPVRASRGKYSHAYAQICWQLFRWISINPKCLKTYVRTLLWVPNTDWCSLHDQLRRSCHTV